ncbi:YlbF family regulator [Halostella pelagica]|uniref:YlbF family regulator n=1 Tax=Halostella pelagica TaxID=2583824 RepID=UPI001081B246|nr:YlbF family regulator [Halostella pelagica]
MSIEIDAGEDEVDVEELGRELGETIAEMPEYRAFEEAKKAVERSDEAQAKIEEFEQIRQDFMLARQTGDATQEDLREVQEAQQELHSVPVMSEYLDTQNELDARLEAVNEAISEPLSVDFGEEAGGCCQD